MDEPPKRKVGRPKKEKPEEPKRPVGRPKKEKPEEPKRPVGRPKKEKPIVEEAIRILEGPAPAGGGEPGKALITKTTTEPEPEPVLKKTLVTKTATEALPTEPEWVAFNSRFETEEEYDQWERAFLTDLAKLSYQGVFVTYKNQRLLIIRHFRDFRDWEVYGVNWKTADPSNPEALSTAPIRRGLRTIAGDWGEYMGLKPPPESEWLRPNIPKPAPPPTADELRARKLAKQEASIARGKEEQARSEAERAEREARHKREREERDARLLEEDRAKASAYDAFRKSYRKSTDYKGWEKKLVAKFQEEYDPETEMKAEFVLSRQGNPYIAELNFKRKELNIYPLADWKLARKDNPQKFAEDSSDEDKLLNPQIYFSEEQLNALQDRVLRRE